MKRDRGSVYLISCAFVQGVLYKIGFADNVERRLIAIKQGMPLDLKIVHEIPVDRAGEIERELHRYYHDFRRSGEWFDLSDDDVGEFPEMVKELAAGNRLPDRVVPDISPAVGCNVHLINPHAFYTIQSLRELLSLRPGTIPREIRLGRLKISKRSGRCWIFGGWVLDWLHRGEKSRACTAEDRAD